mgnify:CR=1 FL=1
MPVVFGLGACLGLEKTESRFKWFTQIYADKGADERGLGLKKGGGCFGSLVVVFGLQKTGSRVKSPRQTATRFGEDPVCPG